MHNLFKRAFALVLCLMLVFTLPLTVQAEETEESQVIRILRTQQLLDLAENCILDRYSQDLTVVLLVDIDLTGTDFEGFPIFCGTFDGNGHTISGLSITGDGSNMGLFRFVGQTAVIQDLTVTGEVNPGGSSCAAGGIAGSNAGRIINCTFTGTVSGADDVGGIAGINTLTGIIESCNINGQISGDHRIGGAAGSNTGVIRLTNNRAEVNTTEEENQVNLSDITLSTIAGTETVSTVTDIGGIAGQSSGVIRQCKNRGNVGYQHMGYNVGGIAGTQSGYIYKCENFAQVYGRKEVGGIVGQMEPTTTVEYTEDTMQILQRQLNTLGNLANQAVSSAQSSSSAVFSQAQNIHDSIQAAKDAVDTLKPDLEEPSLPDWDSIEAAKNTLSSSLTDMKTSLNAMVSSGYDSMDSLNRTLRSLSSQISAMGATLSSASENLGGLVRDISDLDTADILSGKIAGCANSGAILADMNAGGIAGAMAVENDLDMEDDIQFTGNSSLNYNTELRAVVLDCRNTGSVTVKRRNAGGIVGLQSLGLVKDCLSTGELDGENADYVGGISGQSEGYIRGCSANAAIAGSAYVGGIAGKGITVTDCRSLVQLTGTEYTGSILGTREAPSGILEDDTDTEAELTDTVTGNFYLALGRDIGGIDGVSYDGCAQRLPEEKFTQLEGLDPVFHSISIRFVYEDGNMRTYSIAPGEALPEQWIPALPEKAGYTCYWEGLDETDLTAIAFDTTFRAVYQPEKKTVQSEAIRENGLPILLAQGQFREDVPIGLTVLEQGPALEENQRFLEGHSFTLPAGSCTALRYLPESAWDSETSRLYVQGADGSWRETECTQDGRYLVFAVQNGDRAFCVAQSQSEFPLRTAVTAGAVLVLVILGATLLVRCRSRRKKARSPEKS